MNSESLPLFSLQLYHLAHLSLKNHVTASLPWLWSSWLIFTCKYSDLNASLLWSHITFNYYACVWIILIKILILPTNNQYIYILLLLLLKFTFDLNIFYVCNTCKTQVTQTYEIFFIRLSKFIPKKKHKICNGRTSEWKYYIRSIAPYAILCLLEFVQFVTWFDSCCLHCGHF